MKYMFTKRGKLPHSISKYCFLDHESFALQILAANLDVTFPCANYIGDVAAGPDWSRDPLRALIDGKLAQEDGTSLNVIFL